MQIQKDIFGKAQFLREVISVQEDWLYAGECLSLHTALYFASVTTYLV